MFKLTEPEDGKTGTKLKRATKRAKKKQTPKGYIYTQKALDAARRDPRQTALPGTAETVAKCLDAPKRRPGRKRR